MSNNRMIKCQKWMILDGTYRMSKIINEYIKSILSLSDDSGLVFEQSLVHITAEWMGYNLNEENFVDGAGDSLDILQKCSYINVGVQ
jgi:hypothetical protein